MLEALDSMLDQVHYALIASCASAVLSLVTLLVVVVSLRRK